MQSEYRPLGDFVTLASGNTPSKANAAYWGGATPWVSAKDMAEFWIEDAEDHLTELGVNAASRLVPAGTVLMLARGMTLHKRVPICRVVKPSTFNQDVKAVLPKKELSARFLPYLLVGNHDRLHERVDSAGHGTGRLNTDAILSFPVLVPCESMQEEIADIGEAIDHRLRLLRQTNATLESIAQALFKSWFIDFGPVRTKAEGREPAGMNAATAALFPAAFEESALGSIPKGWTATDLSSICELTKGCSYKGNGLSDTDGAFMFNLGCFNARRVFATEKVKRYTGEYRPRHAVAPGDLMIANTDMTQARDILGRPLLIPEGFEPGFVSHHVFKVSIKAPDEQSATALRHFLFFKFQEHKFRERAIGFATGTTVLALPAAAVLQCPACIPESRVLQAWHEVVSPLFHAIHNNERRCQQLEVLRDTLLPRLISGKLCLPEAQAQLEDALS